MKHGPDIARIAALIGDPARANMLNSLAAGPALTASELAAEAGVTKQTASAHLGKLLDAGLVAVASQGRHRYFRLEGDDVAQLLEQLMGVAAERKAARRVRIGPKEPALRRARVCYDHLAGELGVALFDAMSANKWLSAKRDEVGITPSGRRFFTEFGIDLEGLEGERRPLCRACLDWSERRTHLAGSLGEALLVRVFDLGWARREKESRVVTFTRAGESAFTARFRLRLPDRPH